MRLRFFVLGYLAIVMIACSSVKNVVTPPDTQENTAYPAPLESSAYPMVAGPVPETAYPLPSPQIIPGAIQTPDSSKGSVTGSLILKGEPVVGVNLYLGEVITDDKGVKFAASLKPFKDPQVMTNETGNFEFINVPPGEYSLILDMTSTFYLLYKPGTQEGLFINVNPSEEFDLGVLDYSELPIPPN